MRILLFTLFILLVSGSSFSADHTDHEKKITERLSIEETVRIAKFDSFHRWFSFQTVGKQTNLNPDARPEIYKIINDPNAGMDSARVTLYFGLLGEEEDVEKLESVLAGFNGKTLSMEQEQTVFAIIETMRTLEYRGVKSARVLLDKMMTPGYWQKLNFKVMIKNEARPAEEQYGPWAIAMKGSSGDPKTKEKVKAIYNAITDESLKGKYTYQVNAVDGQHDRLMESRRTGDWTIFYGKPDPTPTPTPVPTTNPLEIHRKHPEFAYEEFYTSTTLWTIPAKLDPAVEEWLCKEALTAFDAILQAVVKRDEKYLVTNTAVAGRPLLLKEEQNPENMEKIYAKIPELKKKWQGLIPLAQAFQGKVQSPTQHFVQLQAGFGINRATGGSVEAPPTAHITKSPKSYFPFLLIRFRYDDLKDMVKKYPDIFTNKGRIPSVSETGEPYVVMIWEGDRWYWNPFGM